jgi:hypothetical protein
LTGPNPGNRRHTPCDLVVSRSSHELIKHADASGWNGAK